MKNYTYLDLIEALGIGGAHPGGQQLTKYIFSREKITKAMTVLDAGCGTGQTSAFLYKKFNPHIISIDINKALLQKAQKRFNELKLPIQIVHGDIQQLPFQSSSFDYVISESVLTFTNIHQSVLEYARVLKNGGILIANEMTIENTLSSEEKEQLQQFYGFTDFKTEKDWINQFKQCGFNIIDIHHPHKFSSSLFQNNTTEFDVTTYLSEEIFFLLDQHEYFMKKYENILSYRVYKAICKNMFKS